MLWGVEDCTREEVFGLGYSVTSTKTCGECPSVQGVVLVGTGKCLRWDVWICEG